MRDPRLDPVAGDVICRVIAREERHRTVVDVVAGVVFYQTPTLWSDQECPIAAWRRWAETAAVCQRGEP
jgi:hypothetical protein